MKLTGCFGLCEEIGAALHISFAFSQATMTQLHNLSFHESHKNCGLCNNYFSRRWPTCFKHHFTFDWSDSMPLCEYTSIKEPFFCYQFVGSDCAPVLPNPQAIINGMMCWHVAQLQTGTIFVPDLIACRPWYLGLMQFNSVISSLNLDWWLVIDSNHHTHNISPKTQFPVAVHQVPKKKPSVKWNAVVSFTNKLSKAELDV